jgi:glycosyltransferase involved in cell wall biosynthesis
LKITGDTAAVIIATTGRDSLRRAVDSVLAQTHDDVTCVVVSDGPKFAEETMLILSSYHHVKRVQSLYLPQNTGANGYVCHRIYGAVPLLLNQDYIFYLDDDNWYEPDHVRNCIAACVENDLEWCFALRNIYHNGEYLCRDDCESLGLWPVWYNRDFAHVDTNCYCIRRDVAITLASRWHKSRMVDGKVQPSADTQLCNYLNRSHPRRALVPKYTVNYELGSWELSPRPEFFTDGNIAMVEQYGGKLPWVVQ